MGEPNYYLGYNVGLLNHYEELFLLAGCEILRTQRHYSIATIHRKFNSFFCAAPRCCAAIWLELHEIIPSRAQPKHLLYAMLFLRVYDIEHINAILVSCTEKTFRKWAWTFIRLVANIDSLINFDRRFDNAPPDTNYYVSLDATDCPIQEPTEFSPRWFSHKLNGPGLKYEVGLNIRSGDIVWINGGVPCGEFSDLKLARDAFVEELGENELAIADDTYKDAAHFIYPSKYPQSAPAQKRIMARHETVNSRFKNWRVLSNTYRHDIDDHVSCFKAIANIEQLKINFGYRLYDL